MARPRNLHRSFEVHGTWSRWTKYELVSKTIFRADSAELHPYDPWDAFRRNEGARLKTPQPYLRLLNLGKQIRECRPDKKLDLVLAWCKENGLLGILPVFADRLLFPPVVVESESGWGYRAVQVRYLRSGGIWRREDAEGPWQKNRKDALKYAYELDPLVPAGRLFETITRAMYTKLSVFARLFPLT